MPQDLTCPKCGGPLPPEAARVVTTCPYCGTSAAPPPAVVERRVERVVVVAPEGEEAGKLRCPRCAAPLLEDRARDTIVSGCGRCGGVWLQNAAVERLQNHRDTDVEEVARRLVGLVIAQPPNRRAEISCPECGAAMRRVADTQCGHCVDTCDAHGTWFDRQELPHFIRTFEQLRAGEISDDDLSAAGVPGGAPAQDDGGFFTDLFRSLRLMR